MDQTFTLLPLHLDPTSKAVSSPLPHLAAPLAILSNTHRTLVPLQGQIPPPPLPTNPKRSAQIQKMRDQGNTSLRRSTAASAQEAVQLYTYGVDMALGRPGWEPAALVRDEAATLYANRAQAYMAISMWPEGAADGATSVELKRGGNGKAWWRRGKCLAEMGRWEEAKVWVREGLEVEGNEGDLAALNREIEAHLAK
ncbi:hypothetical protein MMC29_004034 [Sticta canariensis]|nr:hypothetical protein [Sticta canariensis]